jgi:hypothetical protein
LCKFATTAIQKRSKIMSNMEFTTTVLAKSPDRVFKAADKNVVAITKGRRQVFYMFSFGGRTERKYVALDAKSLIATMAVARGNARQLNQHVFILSYKSFKPGKTQASSLIRRLKAEFDRDKARTSWIHFVSQKRGHHRFDIAGFFHTMAFGRPVHADEFALRLRQDHELELLPKQLPVENPRVRRALGLDDLTAEDIRALEEARAPAAGAEFDHELAS